MAPPLKYKDPITRNSARIEQRRRYAESERYAMSVCPILQLSIYFRGKATRSVQNRAAYKHRNGRRGSPVIPFIHPMIPHLATDPMPLTNMICVIFHSPKLVMSDPLSCEAILNFSEEDSNPTQSDIIHGLYLRHERDTQNERINRFTSNDIVGLQRDVGQELRVLLKIWVKLWKKEMTRWHDIGLDESDDHGIDFVHLRWISRIIKGLRDELFSLGTACRRQDYVSSIRARQVEVPNM